MVFSITVQSPPLFRIPHSAFPLPKPALQLRYSRIIVPPLQASRPRIPNFPQDDSNSVDDPRKWRRTINSARGGIDDDYEDDGNDDNDEEERSLDLLVRFLRNMFKKVSKRARTAVRSVLPQAISTKLVGFSVNGVLVLAFLWIFKAFLEVVCTLGSVVFVSILLIRGVWSGVTYLQESRSRKLNELDEEFHTWNGAQPVA
ncbi:protein SHORT HYPOCOTYL IN WHITE LIGHT 1 [Neltuma alba]|uniref:protein SHORT HYPOCOTYL IN WHITE LIGHT 1 n=1 Tax=Neltuma alba TaxID=207710 RepID=UPI0010A542CD|nr:protein SHORT HYPOCOTYL IN WHITE LIGHT 1 [Prosopis alba]